MSQTDENKSLIGATLDGRYEVIKEIGQGSMGAVFEGRHVVLGRRLAIKVLRQDAKNPSLRERFFNEAKAAGSITHQHIVQVQDFGVCPSGEPYYVMEHVDGESLQMMIDRDAPLAPDDAVEICAQTLSALEVIHKAGLVHRDVKPANIMLVHGARPRLQAKLLDFGIVKAIDASWNFSNLTRVNEVLGTPVYLAPEQAIGGAADPRWDLFSMGTILYEMLSGELPFPLESLPQISEDIIHVRFTPLRKRRPDLPPWIYAVLEKVHHRDEEKRFQTASEFLQALDRKKAKASRAADHTVPYMRLGEPEAAQGIAPITTDEFLSGLPIMQSPTEGRGDTEPGSGTVPAYAVASRPSEQGEGDTVVNPSTVEGGTDPAVAPLLDPFLIRTDPFPRIAPGSLEGRSSGVPRSSALRDPRLEGEDGSEGRPEFEQELETVKLELPHGSLLDSPTDELEIASKEEKRAEAASKKGDDRAPRARSEGRDPEDRSSREERRSPVEEERRPSRAIEERRPSRAAEERRPPVEARAAPARRAEDRSSKLSKKAKVTLLLIGLAVAIILTASAAIVLLLSRP